MRNCQNCGQLFRPLAKEARRGGGKYCSLACNYTAKRRPPDEHSYAIDGATGCWVWLKGRTGRGYGVIQRNGKQIAAHRFFYQQHHGPIPADYHVHHVCENKVCVNPAHLEALPPKEHYRLSPTVKLTLEDANQIRIMLASGETQASIAKRYGVAFQSISEIALGKTWV